MTTGAAQPHRLELRLLLLRRPELGALVVIVIAWATLVAFSARGLPGGAGLGMAGMPGMPAAARGPAAPHGVFAVALGGLAGWILMCIAMMGPAALAGVRHTGLNSLRWRRGRAMAEFAAAYLAVWAAFGVAALALNAVVIAHHGLAMLAAVLALSAAWQLTPFKRRALRDCHRSIALPLWGWPAEKGALRFGMRNGLSCLRSCWCLMLVMLVAPGAGLLWMLALTAIITAERLLERPRQVTRLTARALAVMAVVVFGVACNAGLLG